MIDVQAVVTTTAITIQACTAITECMATMVCGLGMADTGAIICGLCTAIIPDMMVIPVTVSKTKNAYADRFTHFTPFSTRFSSHSSTRSCGSSIVMR